MSAFCPQTRSTGNLPHLSFIMRKPEDLGTEFKVVACLMTGILLHLEIQKGCDAMRQSLILLNLVALQGAYYAWLKIQSVRMETAMRMAMAMQMKVNKSSILEIHGLHQFPAQLSFGSIIVFDFLVL